eukprot:COSAG01_NODE_10604_length_2123_cov_8.468874_3_plen_65_part_00
MLQVRLIVAGMRCRDLVQVIVVAAVAVATSVAVAVTMAAVAEMAEMVVTATLWNERALSGHRSH